MTTVKHVSEDVAWYALSPDDVARQIGVDPDRGLDAGEVTRRLAEYGPNELAVEPPPSVWVVGRGQLANPMNIMLLIVSGAASPSGRWRRASWCWGWWCSTSSWARPRS
jgi:Ca2+-transporting ATPase